MKTHMLTAVAAVLVAGFAAWCVAAPVPEVTRPREQATLKGHGDVVADLAFSPDGKVLASACNGDGTVKLWNVANGKCVATFEVRNPEERTLDRVTIAVAFSPDGKTVAVGNSERTVMLWDVATGKNTVKLEGHRHGVTSIAFSPDGKTLISADKEGVRLWDLETRKERASRKIPCLPPALVAYGTTNKPLIAAVHNVHPESLALWDVDPDKQPVACDGHTKSVLCFAFSRDGKTVASAGADRTVRLWDPATGTNTATFEAPPGQACRLAFSPDGKVVAYGHAEDPSTGTGGAVTLYEVASGKILATLENPVLVTALAFSPDGRLLASAGGGRSIKLWEMPVPKKGE